MNWRLIRDDDVSASFGLAADEWLAQQAGKHAVPPALRLYTYHSHCALVGRHQNVVAEINGDYCAAHGIAVNRRPTGGGAIIMGADQLGVALTLPLENRSGTPHRIRELFARFSHGIIAGLDSLGIHAEFGGKNDIEVRSRKIAGLGIYHDPSGGLLFHASVLVDLDLELMLRVLKTPFEKISDKALATVAQRITTVRGESGRDVTLDAVRATIADGYAQTFGVALSPHAFSAEELADIKPLERDKYQTGEWLAQKTLSAGASGSARVKTPGGLLHAQLTLSGDVIKAIYITGDFFAADESVNGLERVLRWHAADAQSIQAAIGGFCANQPDAFEQISASDFVRLVIRAAEDAKRKALTAEPYGCFVNP
jgi:lipoate---protein ligase